MKEYKTLAFSDIFGDRIEVTPLEFHVDMTARLESRLGGDICNGCGHVRVTYKMGFDAGEPYEVDLKLPILLSKDSEFYVEEFSGYLDMPYIGFVRISDLIFSSQTEGVEIQTPNETIDTQTVS